MDQTISDSTTPGGVPIDLGDLDAIRPSEISPAIKLFPCLRYEFVLRNTYDWTRKQWFKFHTNSNCRLYIHMFEEPDTTLTMQLWNVGPDGKLRKYRDENRGNAEEEINEAVPHSVTFYLEANLDTGGNIKHRPDGTNLGRIVFAAKPEFIKTEPDTGSVDFGVLALKKPVNWRGSAYCINERDMNVRNPFATRECPIISTRVSQRDKRHVFSLDKDGTVAFSLGGNWYGWTEPRKLYISKINTGQWKDVTNTNAYLSAGRYEILIGNIDSKWFFGSDCFTEYNLTLTRTA